jgi:hypothetical protein
MKTLWWAGTVCTRLPWGIPLWQAATGRRFAMEPATPWTPRIGGSLLQSWGVIDWVLGDKYDYFLSCETYLPPILPGVIAQRASQFGRQSLLVLDCRFFKPPNVNRPIVMCSVVVITNSSSDYHLFEKEGGQDFWPAQLHGGTEYHGSTSRRN